MLRKLLNLARGPRPPDADLEDATADQIAWDQANFRRRIRQETNLLWLGPRLTECGALSPGKTYRCILDPCYYRESGYHVGLPLGMPRDGRWSLGHQRRWRVDRPGDTPRVAIT